MNGVVNICQRPIVLVLFILCAYTLTVTCHAQTADYTREVYEAIAGDGLTSVSAAIVFDGRVQHVIARGYANKWSSTRSTPETIYPFADVTSTLTATGICMLAADGRIQLDNPARKHMGGIEVKGEDPRNPVRIRHILAHAAGLVDSREPMEMHYGTLPAQPMLLLFAQALFSAAAPATEVRYSRVGYGALGLILSTESGQPIPEFFRQKFLQPLGMRSTDLVGTGPAQERYAVGYTRTSAGRDGEALQITYVSPSSPMLGATGLAGTARDLAQWLLANLNGGTISEKQVIPAKALEEMHRLQFPALRGRAFAPQSLLENDEAGWGLGWLVSPCDADTCIAQVGQTRGYTAVVLGNLQRKSGVALLTNTDSAQAELMRLGKRILRLTLGQPEASP